MTEQTLRELMNATAGLSLLYVEDNADARESTLDTLSEFFSDIAIAKNGREGFVKSTAVAFDLIITDINMPVMSGLEMIEAIRQSGSQIPVLILSAYNEAHYFIETIKLGVEGYLLKPISFPQFVDALMRTVRNIMMRRENEAYKHELERKVEENVRQLYHAYSHDDLTNLPNAVMLGEVLHRKTYTHIMLLDVADFRLIGREYGRAFADDALRAIGEALRQQAQPGRLDLFKVESDRFVFLFEETPQLAIRQCCEQLIGHFDTTNVRVDGSELNVHFSIGVAAISAERNPIVDAEYALEESKAIGKRHYVFFKEDEAHGDKENETLELLNITKRLIQDDGIVPYFQPIKSIRQERVVKYEVLARGIVNGRVLQPFLFLKASERLGMITMITRTIIDKSFAFFSQNAYDFSINITERDLIEGYLVPFLTDKFSVYGIVPERLTLEILENITVGASNAVVTEQLKALQGMGMKIAIDDFGVENSNFSRMLDLDIDIIKIDGRFIRNIVNGTKDRNIVSAIISLAKVLDIRTVAEFVENEQTCSLLAQLGIDYVQGYYIGKPDRQLLETERGCP